MPTPRRSGTRRKVESENLGHERRNDPAAHGNFPGSRLRALTEQIRRAGTIRNSPRFSAICLPKACGRQEKRLGRPSVQIIPDTSTLDRCGLRSGSTPVLRGGILYLGSSRVGRWRCGRLSVIRDAMMLETTCRLPGLSTLLRSRIKPRACRRNSCFAARAAAVTRNMGKERSFATAS